MSSFRKKCSKCSVTRAKAPSVTYHRFPYPGHTNIVKAYVWAKYCWPEKSWNSYNELFKLYKSQKLLCGKHFDDSQFYDNQRQKLSVHAVPDPSLLKEAHNLKENFLKEMAEINKKQPQNLSVQAVPDPCIFIETHNHKENLKEVQNKDILDGVGLNDFQDDPRSPSPEQDIEVNMCRICLQSFSKLISIESYGLRTAYEQLTGVSVEHDDGLPRELCVECATLLDKYHKFRDKSIQGDQILRQIYNKDGVTEKFPLEEIEQAILNLASKIDLSREVTCINIDPEDTEYKVPESEDLTNNNTDLNKTSESNVIETDLDMIVDEPVEEEWLTLSDKDNDEHIMSPTATSVDDIDDEVSIKEEELDLGGEHTDPLDSEDVNIQQEIENIDEDQQTDTRDKSLPKHPDTQVLCQDKHPETQLLSLLKQIKTRKSLVKESERQPLSLVKHPETRHTNLVKQDTRRINILKHPEIQRMNTRSSRNTPYNIYSNIQKHSV